jgi:hypothetical protein
MKYLHDGKTYVIFTVYEGLSHSDVLSFTESFTPKHAGFLVFKCEEQTKEAQAYGKSTSLKLKSEPFDYDEVNYVGVSPSEYIIISNSSEILEQLGCTDVEIAVWKESEEGNYGECPVMYPGHSSKDIKACTLLRM